MDAPLIAGALAAVKNILDIGRNIEDHKVSSAITSAVIDVQSKLIQAQQVISEVLNENLNLKEEVRTLKHAQDFEDSVMIHDGVYWRKRDGREDGPFCPNCWGLNRKLVLLSIYDRGPDPMRLWCRHHGTSPTEYEVPKALAQRLTG